MKYGLWKLFANCYMRIVKNVHELSTLFWALKDLAIPSKFLPTQVRGAMTEGKWTPQHVRFFGDGQKMLANAYSKKLCTERCEINTASPEGETVCPDYKLWSTHVSEYWPLSGKNNDNCGFTIKYGWSAGWQRLQFKHTLSASSTLTDFFQNITTANILNVLNVFNVPSIIETSP